MNQVKTFVTTILGAALAFGFVACGEKAPKNIEVTITIENKELELALGKSIALKVKVTPESEVSKVVWTSSKPEVATVDNHGKVISKAIGETEIKAAIGDKSAVCKVAVALPLRIDPEDAKLLPGKELHLKLIAAPEIDLSNVVWSSSKPEVAAVDEQGKVLPQRFGVAEIKATLGEYVAICSLAVTLDGNPFDLNEELCLQYVWDYKANKNITYKGDKPAVIDFWATWCAPCIAFDPTLKKIAMEYEGRAYIFKADVSNDNSEGEPILKAIGRAPNDPGIYIPPYRTLSLPSYLLLPADGSAPKAIIGPNEQALRLFIEGELAKGV